MTVFRMLKSDSSLGDSDSRRPSFKGGDGEESHHGHQHVVEVEVAVVPHPLVDGRLVHISVLVQDVGAPVRG